MEIYLNLNDLPSFEKPTAAAIGNFDGVHAGHQHIFKRLLDISQKHTVSSVAVTFFPHPGKMIHPQKIQLIQTLNQRLDDIASFQIDIAVVIPFDKDFAATAPSDFVENILHENLRAQHVIVGSNFKFGKNRSGDTDFLKKSASFFNICVHSVGPVKLNDEPVSSSAIRRYLHAGQIEKANLFLGKPYSIRGRVIKGHSRGRMLGFPTANLLPENEILPPGVFITRSRFNGKKHPSLTNIGTRPTFHPPHHGKNHLNVETYLTDIDSPLYGKHMTVEILKKIRNEKCFRNPEALRKQIRKDLQSARAYFEQASSVSP